MPKVSVIIPTYNCAKYVTEAIESVLAQTYKDYEIIVVDDGSTDNTKEVLKPYIDKGLIRYIYQGNKGVSAARNRGIEEAKGEYIAFLDADDVWTEEFLLEMIHEDVDFVISGVEILYHDEYGDVVDNRLEKKWNDLSLCFLFRKYRGLIATPGRLLFTRRLFDLYGMRWDESFKIREDWDIIFQVFSLGPARIRIKFRDRPMFKYKIRKTGVTRTSGHLWLWYDYRLLKKWKNSFYMCELRELYADYVWDLSKKYVRLKRDYVMFLKCAVEVCRTSISPVWKTFANQLTKVKND